MTRDTSQLGKLWAERMTKSERDTSFPDSEPRDAATMMLIDRSGPVPKVLLGRRHHGHKFMPGKFVFPGGRIEALDATMSAVSEIHPDMQAKLNERVANASPQFARALALTAIREVAEETGLEVRITGPLDSIEYWFVQSGTRIHKTVHYFLMEPTGGDLSRHDHEFEQVRWIGFDEASTTLTFETERALVAHAGDLLAAGAGPAVDRRLDASAESAS